MKNEIKRHNSRLQLTSISQCLSVVLYETARTVVHSHEAKENTATKENIMH